MIHLNTYGQKTKVVKAKVVMELEFLVGGEDDQDRMDAVAELFDDHYDEIADHSFLRDSLTGLSIKDIHVV